VGAIPTIIFLIPTFLTRMNILKHPIPIIHPSVNTDTVVGPINNNSDVFYRRPCGSISDEPKYAPVASYISATTRIIQAQRIKG